MMQFYRVLRGALLCGVFSGLCLSQTEAYEGFGAETPGGEGQSVYWVTSLSDSGSGTLRDAVSRSNRYVKFDVAGTIRLENEIRVKGSYITIDGDSAPSPGIILKGAGLLLSGRDDAHDVIVRHIRVRDARDDGFGVQYGAYNIVLDHVSAQGSEDGNIDITGDARDVTVSWSIFADPLTQKNSLIAYRAKRITMHHNLFSGSIDRNPNISYDYDGASTSSVTVDFRNNLVWDWGKGVGGMVQYSAKANLVRNYVYSSRGDDEDGLVVCGSSGVPDRNKSDCNYGEPRRFARAYLKGNVNPGLSRDLNEVRTESEPFDAPAITQENACDAADRVKDEAGAWPRDSIDEYYLSNVSIRSSACE